MNVYDIIKFAQKQADYDMSVVSILETGLRDTCKSVYDLDETEQLCSKTISDLLRVYLKKYGTPCEIAITIVAYEIQIKNAQDRMNKNNN